MELDGAPHKAQPVWAVFAELFQVCYLSAAAQALTWEDVRDCAVCPDEGFGHSRLLKCKRYLNKQNRSEQSDGPFHIFPLLIK